MIDGDRDAAAGYRPSVAGDPPSPQLLNYAAPMRGGHSLPPFDGFALLLGLGQMIVAALVGILLLNKRERGYTELDGAAWWEWLAWHVTRGRWLFWAWVVASLVGSIGATRLPDRRRRWYRAYAAIWVVCLFTFVAGLVTLDAGTVHRRWVSFNPTDEPDSWHSATVEPSTYFQIPLVMAIANPLVVLLAFRALQGRVDEAVQQSPA